MPLRNGGFFPAEEGLTALFRPFSGPGPLPMGGGLFAVPGAFRRDILKMETCLRRRFAARFSLRIHRARTVFPPVEDHPRGALSPQSGAGKGPFGVPVPAGSLGTGKTAAGRELLGEKGRLTGGRKEFRRKRLENGKNLVNNCELSLHWGESPFIMGLSFELCRLRRGDARGGAGF